MKKVFTFIAAMVATMSLYATTHIILVRDTREQTITGFGAASCDGAMKPYGTDTQPANLLYNPQYKICLNIMRMEISPSFTGDNWGD